ncbi:TetR/AcrR family transcriptional regulator [Rhizobium gallicum]|uniref:TetR/AcrR family transcriptional regulator n=1 Tax=Rhizobium gallicum TaxID=56730 RepID=UPI001EF7E11B|nr:TetR/AcrR family transcriptional regulator [Rhizobium gallicum]ULJ70554.1 TetR/AcrR family transcriptional regulator [Rhizobium gallicum]
MGCDVFIEYGYINTTVDVIAARCGISKRTFYEFFNGKADLLRDILKSRSDSIFFVPEIDDQLPLEEQLARIFFIDEDGAADAPGMNDYFMIEVGWEAAEHVAELRDDFSLARAKLAEWLRQMKQKGRITVADADAAATMLIGIVFGSLSIGRAEMDLEKRAKRTRAYLRSSLNIFAKGLTA